MNPRNLLPAALRLALLGSYAATQAIRAQISPPIPAASLRPSPAEIAAQRSDDPRPVTPRTARPAAAWFAELEEHFPRAYLHAFASDFDQLREVSGCTPREAASYAFAYWQAPRIA